MPSLAFPPPPAPPGAPAAAAPMTHAARPPRAALMTHAARPRCSRSYFIRARTRARQPPLSNVMLPAMLLLPLVLGAAVDAHDERSLTANDTLPSTLNVENGFVFLTSNSSVKDYMPTRFVCQAQTFLASN